MIRFRCLLLLGFSFAATMSVRGADLSQAERLFRTGQYDECIEAAKAEVERTVWNEGWPRLLVLGYLTTGRYDEAVKVYEANIERFATSIRLRMLGAQAYRLTNEKKKADEQLDLIPELVRRVSWQYTSKAALVALGDFFLTQGEDPKQVLELCYDKAIKEDPKYVEAYVAAARLAVSKMDDQVALASLKKAVVLDDQDPEIHYLIARAWANADSTKAVASIETALTINPKHLPSLLWLIENKMDAERYEEAERLLKEVEAINPNLPELWARRATIAHLEGRFEEEGMMRKRALRPWALNPEVDYLIGKQLASHYRFAESVEYQRRALMMQSDFVPAKAQLAQDLLRLGMGDEGWALVDQVRKVDPYDVPIFNLKKLRARIDQFASLEAPGLIVRMDASESKVFGPAVIELLSEARRVLTEKYDIRLEEPIHVEIFPKQSDFAIRTFGLPGGDGFLGVCFGRLITANSPSALDVASNWKSVLWHEYCHVVTLQKTKNRMPRWLSEGISVYEERQRDPRWGQSMSAEYRAMILGDELVPVSQLSSAFLRPKSPMHLQFAYYESSMVVEYWIEKYGLKSLRRVLDDLAVGMSIHEALGRDTGNMKALDAEFEEYARKKAEGLADVDFALLEEPLPETADDWQVWLEGHPKSYWGLKGADMAMLKEKRWNEALPIAETLARLFPNDPASDNGRILLATAYRKLARIDEERRELTTIEQQQSDCLEELLRLIEIDREKSDDRAVLGWCDRVLEIDPMRSSVHEDRAAAAERLMLHSDAIESLDALLALMPIDVAAIHFRLAQAHCANQQTSQAKKHVLLSLEESPRYREALRLLLELTNNPPN